MEYKDAIDAESQYHFDELSEPTQEALYAAAAAEKLNEIFAWQIGKKRGGHAEFNRRAKLARVHVLGVIIGRYTKEEAAKEAGVSISAIERAKVSFCEVFGVQKLRSTVVREKE